VFLIVVRHPFEVVASVVRRYGRAKREALAAWLTHMRFVERQTRGLACMFVDYEALLPEWRTVIARLSTMIEGFSPISETAQRSVDQYLRSASRRYDMRRTIDRPSSTGAPGLSISRNNLRSRPTL
jgi:hypothetical protein